MLGGRNQLRRRYGSESESPRDSYVVLSNGFKADSTTRMNNGWNCSSTSSRDRTPEFMAAVRSMQGGGGGAIPKKIPQQQERRSQFMKIAQSIGKDIANTYTKLEKLTLLAKRKTIFDDRPREIQELTGIIKEDMNCLNRQIGQLRDIAKGEEGNGSAGRHRQSHSSSVVVSLQSKLATMTTDLQQVLEVRTENLKESKNRQAKFSQGQVTDSLPESAISGFHSGSVLAAMDDEYSSDHTAIEIGQQHQSQQLALRNEHSYLQSRADTMQNIESTIVELGGIFSQLAHMIKDQEEIMVRIDSNIDDASLNVEAGHSEILKYFQSVTSNRWLMIKVFGILIFFFILFVIFLA